MRRRTKATRRFSNILDISWLLLSCLGASWESWSIWIPILKILASVGNKEKTWKAWNSVQHYLENGKYFERVGNIYFSPCFSILENNKDSWRALNKSQRSWAFFKTFSISRPLGEFRDAQELSRTFESFQETTRPAQQQTKTYRDLSHSISKSESSRSSSPESLGVLRFYRFREFWKIDNPLQIFLPRVHSRGTLKHLANSWKVMKMLNVLETFCRLLAHDWTPCWAKLMRTAVLSLRESHYCASLFVIIAKARRGNATKHTFSKAHDLFVCLSLRKRKLEKNTCVRIADLQAML